MRRRTLLAAAVPATFGILAPRVLRAQPRTIRLIDAGGLWGEALEKAYIEPFTRKSGIAVQRESPNPLARLVSIVEDDARDVTLYELSSAALRLAKRLDLIEPVDWTRVDPRPMFSEARHDYGFGVQYYSTVMAWRRGVRAPTSWVDFFNTRDFPGPRALPTNPSFAIPLALLGTGIQPRDLYPLDVEAAIAKLTEIKDDVVVWWQSADSPPELMRSNEVHYAITFSGRVAGDPQIEFTFKDAIMNLGYLAVVKNASEENQRAAWQFMHEVSLVENQARAAEIISYTGPSPDLEPLLRADRLDQYPTTKKNKDLQWLQDDDWWEDNGEVVAERWERFLDSL